MNIQENSKKFTIFLNLWISSIIMWGRNNDSWSFERPQKIHGIQPMYIISVQTETGTGSLQLCLHAD